MKDKTKTAGVLERAVKALEAEILCQTNGASKETRAWWQSIVDDAHEALNDAAPIEKLSV